MLWSATKTKAQIPQGQTFTETKTAMKNILSSLVLPGESSQTMHMENLTIEIDRNHSPQKNGDGAKKLKFEMYFIVDERLLDYE